MTFLSVLGELASFFDSADFGIGLTGAGGASSVGLTMKNIKEFGLCFFISFFYDGAELPARMSLKKLSHSSSSTDAMATVGDGATTAGAAAAATGEDDVSTATTGLMWGFAGAGAVNIDAANNDPVGPLGVAFVGVAFVGVWAAEDVVDDDCDMNDSASASSSSSSCTATGFLAAVVTFSAGAAVVAVEVAAGGGGGVEPALLELGLRWGIINTCSLIKGAYAEAGTPAASRISLKKSSQSSSSSSSLPPPLLLAAATAVAICL